MHENAILKQVIGETQEWHEVLICLTVVELLIKPTFCKFDERTTWPN